MSILIRGMEMPKNCGECAIKSWDGEDDVCPFSGISALSIGRQDDCPLVPVPPHGDLIDRDAMYKEFERSGWFNNADRDIAEDVLLDAPTVLEAEEGE